MQPITPASIWSPSRNRPPVILVTACTDSKGVEFGDESLSIAETYLRALLKAGCIPLTMPLTVSREAVAHCVRLADGVVLTGGDDVTPALYASRISKKLRQKLLQPDPARDLRELLIIDEVFRQGKPLLAICRGLQILNVALGGTLWLDIGTQLPHAIEHNRQDLKSEVSHDVQLTSDSLLAKITGLDSLRVNSTHHQAVARVAPLLRVTGRSPDGVVEVMELRPHKLRSVPFLLGVQFHPERLVDRHPEHHAVFEGFALACRLIGKQKDYEAKSIGSGRCE